MLLQRRGERGVVVLGQLACVDRVGRPLEAQSTPDRRDRARVVTADHLDRDVLLPEVGKCRFGIGPWLIGERDERHRRDGPGESLRIQLLVAVGEEDDAAPRLGVRRHRACDAFSAQIGAEHDLGGAEDPRASVAERRTAPLPGARERDVPRGVPVIGRAGEPFADRGHRGVGMRVGVRERRERVLVGGVPVEELDLLHGQASLREGSRLVDAHDVDAGEPLHGLELLDEHPPAREPHHADRERERGQQHETLGNHRHHAGDGATEPLGDRGVAPQLRPEQQRGGRHDRPRDVLQDRVGSLAQLGASKGETASVGRELRRVRLATDRRRAEPTAARGDEAPRQHRVALAFEHRIGLPRDQRLVDLEPVDRQHVPVDDDLVARLQGEHVVEHDVADRMLRLLAVADDPRLRRSQHREPIEGALRAQLLDDPDQRVRDQHAPEQRVLDRADDQDHDEHRPEDEVEPGEDVRANDPRDRARRLRGNVVDLTASHALGDLCCGQPPPWIDLGCSVSRQTGHRRHPPRVSVRLTDRGVRSSRADPPGRCRDLDRHLDAADHDPAPRGEAHRGTRARHAGPQPGPAFP